MSWEPLFVFGLLIAVVLAFVLRWAPVDVVALTVSANPAPITIAAMFVPGAGLEITGCIDAAGRLFAL